MTIGHVKLFSLRLLLEIFAHNLRMLDGALGKGFSVSFATLSPPVGSTGGPERASAEKDL